MTLKSVVPVMVGVTIFIVLVRISDAFDAPGFILVGGVVAFGSIMLGLLNAKKIKAAQLLFILPICFGLGLLVLSLMLKMDGEFLGHVGLFVAGVVVGGVMIVSGLVVFYFHRKGHDA